eukprot:7175019-Alexandrium_andersonii.AAC.1
MTLPTGVPGCGALGASGTPRNGTKGAGAPRAEGGKGLAGRRLSPLPAHAQRPPWRPHRESW